jgi:hypothetical protein
MSFWAFNQKSSCAECTVIVQANKNKGMIICDVG